MRSTVEGTRRAARVFASATALGLVLSGGMITMSATAATPSPNAKSCAAKHPGQTTSAKKMRASCVKKLKARSAEAPDSNPTQTPDPSPSPSQSPDPDTTADSTADAGAGAGGAGSGTGAGAGEGGDADANANTGNNENTNVNEGNDSENNNDANAGGGDGGNASNDNDNDATGGSADNDFDSDITNNNGNVNNNTSTSNVSNSGNSTNTISASGVGNPTAYAYGGAGASNGPINVVVNLPPMTITMPAAQTTALPEAATRMVVTSATAGRTVSVPARAGLAPAAWTRKSQAARIAITGLPSATWQVRVQDHGIWRTLGARNTVNGKVTTPAMRMLAAGSYLLKLDRLRGTDYFVIVQVRN